LWESRSSPFFWNSIPLLGWSFFSFILYAKLPSKCCI